MKQQNTIEILATLLIAMFLYASFSKYFDWETFHRAMIRQPFSPWLASVIMLTLPPVEIVAAILLLFEKTRLKGFRLSALLMLLFSGYIAMALLGAFPKRPCSCGGILRSLGWTQHFVFNLLFLAISIIGSHLAKKQKATIPPTG